MPPDPALAALILFGRTNVPTLAASLWDLWELQVALTWRVPQAPQLAAAYCPTWGLVIMTYS